MNSNQQMENIHKECKKLLLQLDNQVEELERYYSERNSKVMDVINQSNERTFRRRISNGQKLSSQAVLEEGFNENNNTSRNQQLQQSINENLNALSQHEKTLQNLFNNIPRGNNKDQWQRNLNLLSHERQSIKTSIERLLKKSNSYDRDRKLLGLDEDEKRKYNSDNTVEEALMEYKIQNKSLTKSEQLIENMKEMGASALGMLAEQRETIEAAHKKVLDIAASFGVSQSTIRAIERRIAMDKWIIYIGIFFVTCLMILIYYWKFC
ncbi:hypothetical protein ABK040_011608 [Willaertia magna]